MTDTVERWIREVGSEEPVDSYEEVVSKPMPTEEHEAVKDYWAILRVRELATLDGIHDRRTRGATETRQHLGKIETEHREKALNAVIDRIEETNYPEGVQLNDPVTMIHCNVENPEHVDDAKLTLARDVVNRGLPKDD